MRREPGQKSSVDMSDRYSVNATVVCVVLLIAAVIALAAFGGRVVKVEVVSMLGTLTPTATPTPTSTNTPTPTLTPTNTPTATPSPTNTSAPATQKPSSSQATKPTPAGTPTPTPTPVPRTKLAAGLPDPAQAVDHYWLGRPFSAQYTQVHSYPYHYGSTYQGAYLLHHGIDIQNSLGTPVLAVADGEIAAAGSDSSTAYAYVTKFYGNVVIIRLDRELNGQPVYALYGHLSKVLVAKGKRVNEGDVVGEVGMEGVALGPHLHLEVRVGQRMSYDDTHNPELWIRPFSGMGTIAGRLVDAKGYLVPQNLVTVRRADNPDKRWRETWTYYDEEVNPDSVWGETFSVSEVPAGEYVVQTRFDGKYYSQKVKVEEGKTSFVLIQGEQIK